MNISITPDALTWFKEEIGAQAGDFVRFFVRYGGHSPIQAGFSIGVNVQKPRHMAAYAKEDGITFFVEEDDIWYFDDHDFRVAVNSETNEIEFSYPARTKE